MDNNNANPSHRTPDLFSVHPQLQHRFYHPAYVSSAGQSSFPFPYPDHPAPPSGFPIAQITEIPDDGDRDICEMFENLGRIPPIGVVTSADSHLPMSDYYPPRDCTTYRDNRSDASQSRPSEWLGSAPVPSMDDSNRFQTLDSLMAQDADGSHDTLRVRSAGDLWVHEHDHSCRMAGMDVDSEG